MSRGGVAVSAEGLRKEYSLLQYRLLAAVRDLGRAITRRPLKERGVGFRGRVVALGSVTFQVHRGEVVGLIGLNGAGKSTLLRLIAGLAKPTAGTITIDGRVTAILEIHAGLVPDLTGRKNIRYVGRLYGMSEAELDAKAGEILAFAGLGEFAEYPVRAYSTGMRARLAFSIVTAVEPDILLVDEALSVGDAGFALRSRQRIRELCARGSTVILVSHSMLAIRELCDRVIWLHQGQVAGDGGPAEVTEAYRAVAHELAQRELERQLATEISTQADERCRIERLRLLGAHRVEQFLFDLNDELVIEAQVDCSQPTTIRARLEFLRFDGVQVAADETPRLDLRQPTTIRAEFGSIRLGRFTYQVRLALLSEAGTIIADARRVFAVHDDHHAYNASYYQPIEWRVCAGPVSAGSVAGGAP